MGFEAATNNSGDAKDSKALILTQKIPQMANLMVLLQNIRKQREQMTYEPCAKVSWIFFGYINQMTQPGPSDHLSIPS